jgi:hypothetical protein
MVAASKMVAARRTMQIFGNINNFSNAGLPGLSSIEAAADLAENARRPTPNTERRTQFLHWALDVGRSAFSAGS